MQATHHAFDRRCAGATCKTSHISSAAGDYVFSANMGAGTVKGFSRMKAGFDKAVSRELGREVAPYVLHDIRRTVRTRLSTLPIPDLVRELVIGRTQGEYTGSMTSTVTRARSVMPLSCGMRSCARSLILRPMTLIYARARRLRRLQRPAGALFAR